MSEEEVNSSGDECSLRIDTDRKTNSNSEKSKGKGGRARAKGRGKGKGGGANSEPEPAPKPGDVVWAKVTGFNFWPGKIFDPADEKVVPVWLCQAPRPSYILVRFFGTYDMQWVSPNSVETYNKGLSKRFHTKSKSKVFQKAVSEVTAYMTDNVVPEGLTLRPPDPPVDSEDEAISKQPPSSALSPSSSTYMVTCDPADLQSDAAVAASNGSTHRKGSSRRKSSTPRRLSSSSSSDCPVVTKKPCLDSSEAGGRPPSPKVQAFTCAPLPLAATAAPLPAGAVVGGKESETKNDGALGLET